MLQPEQIVLNPVTAASVRAMVRTVGRTKCEEAPSRNGRCLRTVVARLATRLILKGREYTASSADASLGPAQ